MDFLRSTKKHRITQRVNIGAQVLASASGALNEKVMIPFKVTQSITSSYSFFTNNLNKTERAIQAMQALLSSAQIAVSFTKTFTDDDNLCLCDMTTICKINMAIELVYQGLLVGSYALSEARKQQQIIAEKKEEKEEEKETESPAPNIQRN